MSLWIKIKNLTIFSAHGIRWLHNVQKNKLNVQKYLLKCRPTNNYKFNTIFIDVSIWWLLATFVYVEHKICKYSIIQRITNYVGLSRFRFLLVLKVIFLFDVWNTGSIVIWIFWSNSNFLKAEYVTAMSSIKLCLSYFPNVSTLDVLWMCHVGCWQIERRQSTTKVSQTCSCFKTSKWWVCLLYTSRCV